MGQAAAGADNVRSRGSWLRGGRAELAEAMAAGEGERLKFDVGPVELEFAVDVQRDLRARAGELERAVRGRAVGARQRP